MPNKEPVPGEAIIDVVEQAIASGNLKELRELVKQNSIVVEVDLGHKKLVSDFMKSKISTWAPGVREFEEPPTTEIASSCAEFRWATQPKGDAVKSRMRQSMLTSTTS